MAAQKYGDGEDKMTFGMDAPRVREVTLVRDRRRRGRNGRDPAVDQEVCPDDVRRIVRREVNCQLRDFQPMS